MRATYWFILGGVATMGLAAQSSRWATADDKVAQSLIGLERQWAEQECTHAPIIARILADDFKGTAPSGARYTKAEALEDESKSAGESARDCVLDHVDVHFFGDAMAIAYGGESSVTKGDDGKDQKRCLVWTDTWLRRDGAWQIVSAQDALLPCK